MSKVYILLFVIISIDFSILENSNINFKANPKLHESECIHRTRIDSNKFEYVYQLKTTNEEVIGNVYVKWKTDDVFTDLLILNINNGKSDTLYLIQKCELKNKRGVDLSFDSKEFWGYRFGLIKEDYFELIYLSNNGKIESDILTIEYDKQQNIIELLKTP